MIIGVSLKMYFGYTRTLDWCQVVADRTNRRDTELFVLPTFVAVPAAVSVLGPAGIGVGAQDLSARDAGAFTGEVSGAVLAEVGCRYVEVGHAERRTLFGEDDPVVSAKTAAALRHGLVPVLCVGETAADDPAEAATECRRQLRAAMADSRSAGLRGRVIVAYEPRWAIGADQPAGDDHIRIVCAGLRDEVAGLTAHPDSAVIYGGSAGPGLLTRLGSAVDGLFLGRFAHDPEALDRVLAETAARSRTG